PEPASTIDGRDRFALEDVVTWLEITGRGNNRHVREEAALHAILDLGLPQAVVLAGVSTLLTLKSATGSQLASMSAADILVAADDVDPRDDYLYREIAALGADLVTVAAHGDA